MSVTSLILNVVQFYIWIIIAYVLMSWFPMPGVLEEIHRVLGTLVEPYLGLFRRFIPPIGMIDISAIIAILVLQALARLVVTAL